MSAPGHSAESDRTPAALPIGDETGAIELRFLDLSEDALRAELLLDAYHPDQADTIKDRALRRLGIERRDGEGHLGAWCRAMAEENGLPVEKPAHSAIGSAVLCSAASRFVWWLA